MFSARKLFTIVLIVAALGLLGYALLYEEHTVALFDGNTRENFDGDDYVNSIESGQLLRRKADGKLYDAKSLKPAAAQIDDCPT